MSKDTPQAQTMIDHIGHIDNLNQAACKCLIDFAVNYAQSKVDGIEVTVSSSDVATSRFANNQMTQNQAPAQTTVSVRVIKDSKQARLSSDKLSEATLAALIDNAITCAAFMERDPNLLPLVKPHEANGRHFSKDSTTDSISPSVKRFDEQTAKISATERAEAVLDIINIAQHHALLAAGIVSSGTVVEAIGNSEGLFKYHHETTAECSITMKTSVKAPKEIQDKAQSKTLEQTQDPIQDSTGWSKAHSTIFSDLNHSYLAQKAAEKALASAQPQDIGPGRYTVILEPAAVLDLLCFLWSDFTATSHLDKLSCFVERIGQKMLGDNISIRDDAYHPLQAGPSFDGEGLARKPVSLVEAGVIKNVVYGRRSANKWQSIYKQHVAPTGHGLAEPSPEGEFPLNLVVSGGKTSLEEMVRSTEYGLLLTRVWYVREVDPVLKIVTGMTRDGTFLVKDGAIKHAVKNLRFNQGLIEMLNNVVALGPALRTAGEEGFPAVVPAMKVDNFNFSSITTF